MRHSAQIYEAWEAHWRKGGAPTPLGAWITRGKLRHVRRLLAGRKVSSCVDVGCGMGNMLRLLAELTGNAEGLDASPAAVAACRARGLRAMHGDLLDHPGTYDLVFSDGLIEHFDDFRPYVAGLCRMSRRYVMIAQTDHSSPVAQTLLFLERLLKPGVNVPEYPHRLSSFIEEFSRNSFSLAGRGSILLGAFKVLLFEKADTHEKTV